MKSGPLYQTIATDLMQKLKQGDWPPGTKLPTEAELSKTYDASITTIRGAIRFLKDSGLIEVRRGSGAYAIETNRFILLQNSFDKQLKKPNNLVPEEAWATEVRAQGSEPSSRFDCLSSLTTEDLADTLEVDTGSRLIIRRSQRFLDSRPVAIELDQYPAWLTDKLPLLAGPDLLPQGATLWLASNGYVAAYQFDTVEARTTTPEESEFFDEPQPITCLERRRTVYTADQKPFRAISTVYRSNLHSICYAIDLTT